MYIRFLMKNLIRSKEEQFRKQEAEIARKIHEIQSSPSHRDPLRFYEQQPVQSVICGLAIFIQIQFVNECCTSAAHLFGDSHFHSDK